MTKPTPPNPEMGSRAKVRREALGITVLQMSATLGVTSGRYYQMENDGVQSIDVANKWAKALDMNPVDLIYGKKGSKR